MNYFLRLNAQTRLKALSKASFELKLNLLGVEKTKKGFFEDKTKEQNSLKALKLLRRCFCHFIMFKTFYSMTCMQDKFYYFSRKLTVRSKQEIVPGEFMILDNQSAS